MAADPASGGDAAASTTGTSVLRGGSWQLVSRLLPQVYTLVLSVVLARYLGPDDFGRQSLIAFVAISATTLFGGGLKVALMRTVGELLGQGRGAQVRAVASWTLSFQAIGAALGGAALAITGALGAEPAAAWVLAGVWTTLSTLQTVPNAMLLGAQRFRATATIGLVTDTVALPATIAVLVAGGGITGVFAVQAAVAALNLVWTAVVARRMLQANAVGDERAASDWRRPFIRFTAFSTGSAVLTLVVWRRSELFFLAAYSDDSQIAIYSISFAVVAGLILIPGALAGVLAPAFATLFGAAQHDRLRSGFARATRLVMLASLPITAATIALGPPALELVYGEEYSGAGEVLVLLMLVFPFLPIYEIGASVLIGIGRAGGQLAVGALAAIVSIAASFLLIPPLDAVGAAVANSVAQVVAAIGVLLYIRRLLGGVDLGLLGLGRGLAVSLLAGAAAYGIVTLLEGVPGVLAGSLVGVGVGAGTATWLGVISRDDARWLEQLSTGRLQPYVNRVSAALTIRRRDSHGESAGGLE